VDIPTVTLSGHVTVGGKVPTDDFGAVSLRTVGGDSVALGRTADTMYLPKLIVPGTYDVYYSWNSGDNSMPIDIPRNTNARVRQDVSLQQTGALDVDIPVVTLSGRITVDGKVPTDRFGSVRLSNQATGDGVALGRTGDASYTSKLIVPGSFGIHYSWSSGDTSMPIDIPRNTAAMLDCAILN
jgi:hypothetical protein